jgi:tetratricopeptide (TPR) repeat protein
MPLEDEAREPEANGGTRDPIAMGKAAFLAGEIERAKRLADEAISTDPLRQDAWILKGRALVSRYDPAGAKECYAQALEIDEANREAWKRKAFAHRLDGELPDAIDCWERALSLGPGDNRILNDIASAWDDLGEFNTAIGYYEQALQLDPDDSFAKENIRLNERILQRIAERAKEQQ